MAAERHAPRGGDAWSRDPAGGRVLDGRYRLIERIARGGMASVWSATDLRLDRTVAVKIMHPGLGDDREFAARFVGEARAAAALSHPHVVSVFDQGEDDGVVFLAMELVQGHTLRDAITQQSPMTPLRAVSLLEPVVAALAAAHEAGLIHRDVKPENVLVAADGRIKVADFGLAKAITSVTQHTATGMLIGTVSYVAPEIVTEGRSDARGDVYAAGVILYELLTGQKPHAGETPIQIAYRHVHHDVPAPSAAAPGIPPYVDALVARATARDPGLRPSDARVLRHQLEMVRLALVAGVADDPRLTEDLLPRSAADPDRDAPGPPPLAEERPDLAAAAVDPDPWEHDALEALVDTRERVLVPPGPARTAPTRTGGAAGRATRPVDLRPTPATPAGPATPSPTSAVALADPRGPVGPRGPRGATRLTPPPGRPRARRARRGPLLLVLALLVALAVGGGAWWLGFARYTATPGVLGLAQDEATTRLASAGLDVAVDGRAYSDTVPAGAVISSDPAPGDRTPDGSTVDLVVSLGVETSDVPRLEGLDEDAAQDQVAAAGLTFGRSRQEWSETVPAGTVLSSSPRAGRTVRPGSVVDLVVSRGREPVPVGRWEGRTRRTAETGLTRRGLVPRTSEAYSDEVPEGRVVRQDPAAGETLFRGDTVELLVSRGPELVTVPDGLIASGVDAATEALQAAGLVVQVEESTAYVGLRYVISTSPGSGDRVPRGSTVVLSLV